MSTATAFFIDPLLPWDPLPGESSRLRRLLVLMLLLFLIAWVVLPRVQVPVPDRATAEAVPERLAKVVLEKKEEIKPPPPPKKEEIKEEKPSETPEDKPKDAESKPKPSEQQVTVAREQADKAMGQAKAALSDLASLRDEFSATTDIAGGGGNNGINGGTLSTAGGQSVGTSRSLLTSRAGKGSGGLGGYYSAGSFASSGSGGGVGGGKGAGSGLGIGNGSGPGLASVKSTIVAEGESVGRKASKDGKSRRTDEEIRRIFDRNSGALQSMYQRALRDNPALQGSVMLSLSIAPDGSVSKCALLSSELNDPTLETKLVARVKLFNFGADQVEAWEGKWPLNFFPN